MKKNLLTLLAAIAFAFPALAETILYVDEDTNLRYNLDTETQTAEIYAFYWGIIRPYNKFEGTTLTVPQSVTVDGVSYAITVVGKFQESQNLEELIINHPVELSEESFKYCEKLKSITLPEGITHIPDGCFAYTAITDLDFLPSTVKTIGSVPDFWGYPFYHGSFEWCDSLRAVTIPPSVTSLGAYSFENCPNLESVKLNEGLEKIGFHCFSSDSSITSISIPSTVYEIGADAFYRTNLQSVEMGAEVKRLGAWCFSDNSELKELQLPEMLEVVPQNIIRFTAITDFSIPAGVKRFMPAALYGTNINTFIIEDSDETLEFDIIPSPTRDPWTDYREYHASDAVGGWFRNSTISDLYLGRNTATWIPEPDDLAYPWYSSYKENNELIENPFEQLTKLKNLTVGGLVTDASQLTFASYPDLETVTFLSTVPPALCALTPEQAETVIVTVPKGCVDAYRKVPGWAAVKNYREAEGSSEEPSASFSLSDTTIELAQGETKQLTIDVTGLKAGKSTLTVTLTDENGEQESAVCEIIVVEKESDIAEIFNDGEPKTVDIYNLGGVLLKSQVAPEAVLDLPAGIYIVGGKKVLVK